MNDVSRTRAAGIEMAYRFDGPAQAPVVMLSHSVLTDLGMWDGLTRQLERDWRVLRYDTRGHGGSEASVPPYTLSQLADDAVALLDALGVPKVHFIGSSLGGMIGQQLGARHGTRLLSLTLANTTAVQAAAAAWEERAGIARRDGIEALVEPTLQRWFDAGYRERAGSEVQRVADMVRRTSVAGYVGCANAIRDLAHLELLQQIRVPTLVIAGAGDVAIPAVHAEQLRANIPDAHLVTLEAGHQAAVEQPERFADLWQAFAAGVKP